MVKLRRRRSWTIEVMNILKALFAEKADRNESKSNLQLKENGKPKRK